MNSTLQVSAIVCSGVLLIVVGRKVRKREISLRYALLWLLLGAIALICSIWPGILDVLSSSLGFGQIFNLVFILVAIALIILMLSMCQIMSKQSKYIRALVQENALLDRRLRKLEEMDKDHEDR